MGHKKNKSMDFCRSGKTPLQDTTNLLKAVPNEKAYNELPQHQKEGFDKAFKKAGGPTKFIRKDPATPDTFDFKSEKPKNKRNYNKVTKSQAEKVSEKVTFKTMKGANLPDKKQNKGSLYDKKTPLMKTYDEAYETRGKKYQSMDKASYIKEAKAYNKKEYNTENPSNLTYTNKVYKESGEKFEKRRAAQTKRDATGVDKKRNEAYAKKKKATEKPKVGSVTKSEKAKGNLVVNKELMKKAEKNQRVKKATTTEKKEIGPKNRVTVKSAKANKKAGVKEAKQKGYETRKDRREAVRGARKAGKAGVKEARKDKRDLKKAEKNTKKSDKREVKTAIKNAGRASKVGRLKDKKSTVKRRNKIEDLEAKQRLSE
tara:strand:- start:41 stop:1153 length:1113 start_codon:yes stop_codon:yes gene_type:complete